MHASALVMAHGAGSRAEFLLRAFPVGVCGLPVIATDDRTGDVEQVTAGLLRRVGALGGRSVLLGGVSVGAHAAAFAALSTPPQRLAGLVLVMPAWTGEAPPVSATAAAAAEVSRLGAEAVLQRLAADRVLARDWVSDELHLAWRQRPTLAAELTAAAGGPAPDHAELSRITVPALVLALADDPFHPLTVAQEWAGALPSATLVVLPRQAPGPDRAVFGQEVANWLAGLSGPR